VYEIVYYKRSSGKQPARKFINGLSDKKAKARLFARITMLARHGNLPTEQVKKIHGANDLWEIRITSSSGAVRLFYSLQKGKIVLLLSGFIKKTQKTPKREIDKALAYLKDYKEPKHG
jgi:putative addiction module killer protein